MAIPTPTPNEDEQNFISRCVSDDNMTREYPDIKQRLAVCYSQLRAYGLTGNSDDIKEIKVLPFERVWIEKYNEWLEFDEKMADEIIKNFNNPEVIKPIIDKEHEYQESYGDVLELYKKEDGLYAKIKLNIRGIELIKNRIYKSISPSIGSYVSTSGVKYYPVLLAISLVNYPALGNTIPTLQEQINLKLKIKEGKMNFLKKIGEVLEFKLREDITEQEVDLIVSKVEELKALAKENEELKAKIAELETMIKNLKEIEEKVTEKEAEEAVNKMIEQGYIPPSLKELYKKRYKTNKEDFMLEMKAREAMKDDIQTKKNINLMAATNDDKIKELMLKAGIDITNEQSVKNFIEYYNKKGGKR